MKREVCHRKDIQYMSLSVAFIFIVFDVHKPFNINVVPILNYANINKRDSKVYFSQSAAALLIRPVRRSVIVKSCSAYKWRGNLAVTLVSAKKEMSTPKMKKATETIWSPESYVPSALRTNTPITKRTMTVTLACYGCLATVKYDQRQEHTVRTSHMFCRF